MDAKQTEKQGKKLELYDGWQLKLKRRRLRHAKRLGRIYGKVKLTPPPGKESI